MTLEHLPSNAISQNSVCPAFEVAGIYDDFQKEPESYLGATIRFRDKSCWKLTKALCNTKYQQGEPPFEARRVYECVCVEDPENKFVEVKSALIKVKYQ
jgi:hypothetical protein